tara:strand:- start:555 stop:806 length:252 start_codon:yes stop_codon:yes gene_type:complete
MSKSLEDKAISKDELYKYIFCKGVPDVFRYSYKDENKVIRNAIMDLPVATIMNIWELLPETIQLKIFEKYKIDFFNWVKKNCN